MAVIAPTYNSDVNQMKVVFKEWDTSGKGWIDKRALLAVFSELQSTIQASEFGPLLDCFDVKQDGKIAYKDFIDGLFSQEPLQKPAALAAPAGMSGLALDIKGYRSLHAMSPEEFGEVERVLSNALGEIVGEFEGEYFPLPGSGSFPMKPTGMSSEDANVLQGKGLMFQGTSPAGRGVFLANSGDVAAWINERSHLRLLAKDPSKLSLFEAAIKPALRQEGYDFA